MLVSCDHHHDPVVRCSPRTKASNDTLEADDVIMPHVSEPAMKDGKRGRPSFAERIARELAPTKDCLLDKGEGRGTSRWGGVTARTRKQHEGALPEAGDDVWEVARLVDKRKGGGGRLEYLVRWRGSNPHPHPTPKPKPKPKPKPNLNPNPNPDQVRWRGWSEAFDSWEPTKHIMDKSMISQLEIEISQHLEQGGAGASPAAPKPTETGAEVQADEPKPSDAKRACVRSSSYHGLGREEEEEPLLLFGPVIAEEEREEGQLQDGRPAPTKRTRTWVTGVGWLYAGGQGGAEGGAEGGAAKEEEVTAERGPVLSPGSIVGPVVGSGPLIAHRVAACPCPAPLVDDDAACQGGHGGGGKRKRGELHAPPAHAESGACLAPEAKGGAARQVVRQVVSAKVVTQEQAQEQAQQQLQQQLQQQDLQVQQKQQRARQRAQQQAVQQAQALQQQQAQRKGLGGRKVVSLGGREVVSEVNGLQLHLSKHSNSGYKVSSSPEP